MRKYEKKHTSPQICLAWLPHSGDTARLQVRRCNVRGLREQMGGPWGWGPDWGLCCGDPSPRLPKRPPLSALAPGEPGSLLQQTPQCPSQTWHPVRGRGLPARKPDLPSSCFQSIRKELLRPQCWLVPLSRMFFLGYLDDGLTHHLRAVFR